MTKLTEVPKVSKKPDPRKAVEEGEGVLKNYAKLQHSGEIRHIQLSNPQLYIQTYIIIHTK